MQEIHSILSRTQLFSGIAEADIAAILACLGVVERKCKKDEYVFRAGERIRSIAILVKGALLIQKDDYWGNRSIIANVNVGETFGEAYAMQDSEALLNDVLAVEDSTVLLFDVQKILLPCSNVCSFHTRIIQNLMQEISVKNRHLAQKIGTLSQRSTRAKLKAYLSAQSQKAGSACFTIPFNRQQLADYLAVERSAMSNELCKMRDDGLLRFERSRFELIQKPEEMC